MRNVTQHRFLASSARALILCICLAVLSATLTPVLADHTPFPISVTMAGSFQSELGCPGDSQPDCAATQLTFDANDGVWQGIYAIPAGSWEYKAALNGSWDENYGLGAQQNGANIPLSLAAPTSVKFYYDHETHWVTDSRTSVIAVAVGSFQSELGCSGDYDPGCLRSWLQDPDGDGLFLFATTAIPAGSYEFKVAIDESWDENYGAGGVQNGPFITFGVAVPSTVYFFYDPVTHVASVSIEPLGTTTVDIDIKPGSDPNSINLGSNGVIPVAILTADSFDAATVDPVTVLFADASPLRWAWEDVDYDGDVDILLHFMTQELNLDENSTEATVTGATFGGTPFEGLGSVNIVP